MEESDPLLGGHKRITLRERIELCCGLDSVKYGYCLAVGLVLMAWTFKSWDLEGSFPMVVDGGLLLVLAIELLVRYSEYGVSKYSLDVAVCLFCFCLWVANWFTATPVRHAIPILLSLRYILSAFLLHTAASDDDLDLTGISGTPAVASPRSFPGYGGLASFRASSRAAVVASA